MVNDNTSRNMDQKRKLPIRKKRKEKQYNTLNIVLNQEEETFHRTRTMEHESSEKKIEIKPQEVNPKSKSPSKSKSRVNKHSYAYIVQKQEDEKFRTAYPFANHKDFIDLCNASKELNRTYLASVFIANNFNLRYTMSVLPKSKPEIVASVMMQQTIQQNYMKLSIVIEYNWFRINQLQINKRALEEKLKPGKKNIYKNILKRMKENCPDMDDGNKVHILRSRLFELKVIVSQKITQKEYSKIDFHELRAAEAIFILKEVLHDYSTALKKYPDMDSSIKCLTGRGRNSIDGIPVLKNKVIKHLERYKIVHIVFEGYIRVYLENYEGENVKKTNNS